jgi:tRNA dimethylallyltransferase
MSRLVALVGPTATGKTAVGVELAGRIGAEVVNADSMQLYRGMDVGTAKPTAAERRGIPHHVLDVWDVTERASVAEYQRLARGAVDDVLARGRVPLLVGGSGLYVRAVTDELDFPGTDPRLRARLEAELAAHGPATLHRRLSEVDPEAARGILPSNGRRLVRALEVVELTGRPFTATLPGPAERYDTVHIGLDRADLDDRVAVRVDRMWAGGLVAEVRALERLGLREGPTASRALGYQQVLALGDTPAAREQTVTATRRFVRRQRSWFRRDPRVRWLDGAAPDLLDQVLALVR